MANIYAVADMLTQFLNTAICTISFHTVLKNLVMLITQYMFDEHFFRLSRLRFMDKEKSINDASDKIVEFMCHNFGNNHYANEKDMDRTTVFKLNESYQTLLDGHHSDGDIALKEFLAAKNVLEEEMEQSTLVAAS